MTRILIVLAAMMGIACGDKEDTGSDTGAEVADTAQTD